MTSCCFPKRFNRADTFAASALPPDTAVDELWCRAWIVATRDSALLLLLLLPLLLLLAVPPLALALHVELRFFFGGSSSTSNSHSGLSTDTSPSSSAMAASTSLGGSLVGRIRQVRDQYDVWGQLRNISEILEYGGSKARDWVPSIDVADTFDRNRRANILDPSYIPIECVIRARDGQLVAEANVGRVIDQLTETNILADANEDATFSVGGEDADSKSRTLNVSHHPYVLPIAQVWSEATSPPATKKPRTDTEQQQQQQKRTPMLMDYGGLDLQMEMANNQQVATNFAYSLMEDTLVALKREVEICGDYADRADKQAEVLRLCHILKRIEEGLKRVLTQSESVFKKEGSNKNNSAVACTVCGAKTHLSVLDYALYHELAKKSRRHICGDAAALTAAEDDIDANDNDIAERTQHAILSKNVASCVGVIPLQHLPSKYKQEVEKVIGEDVKRKLLASVTPHIGDGIGCSSTASCLSSSTPIVELPPDDDHVTSQQQQQQQQQPMIQTTQHQQEKCVEVVREVQIAGVNTAINTLDKTSDETGRAASRKRTYIKEISSQTKLQKYVLSAKNQ